MRTPAWLAPPHQGDSEEALRARVAHWVLLATIATLVAMLAFFPLYGRDPYTLPVFSGSLAAVLTGFVLLHRGYIRLSVAIVCSVSWLMVMGVSITGGGVRSPQLATMVLVVLLVGFLWNSIGALIAAGITSISILGVIVAAERGLLPEAGPMPAPAADWGAMTSVLVIAAAYLHITLRAIDDSRRALAQKSRELEEEMARREAAEESLRRAQRLEALGRLTGGIAHDFNNLLTVLLAQSSMLAERADAHERLDDEAAREIHDIQVSGERAAALTRRLLGFSRPQSGLPEDVSAAETLGRLRSVLRRVIPESVKLEIRLPPPDLQVRIDPGQLDQVILNLALNARDAMPQGGELRIEGTELSVGSGWASRHAGARRGRHVRIVFSDTGPGIPPEDRERIFDPFFTTKGLGHGAGLGLSTVHGIVTGAGGHVTVESEPGRGATFSVYLPVCDGGPSAIATARADRPDAPGRPTVLLCEDEEPVRKVLDAMLRKAGYRVLAAPLPVRALELAREHPGEIDLLLSDVVMPGMSGPELARTIREEHGPLPVLFVTGYAAEDVDLGRGGQGETELLEKPFSAKALLARVTRLAEPQSAQGS